MPILPAAVVLVATSALVLVVSGVMKLREPARTRSSAVELGLPPLAATRGFAIGFPLVEIAVGAGLLVASGTLFLAAAAAALLLFLVYTVLVARALRVPDPVHCNCFGALSTRPVSRIDLVRNIALVALGVVAVSGLGGTDGVIRAAGAFTGGDWAWTVLVVLLAGAVTILRLLASAGGGATTETTTERFRATTEDDYLRYRDHLQGVATPIIEVLTAAGDLVRIDERARTLAQLLVFVKVDCTPCSTLTVDLGAWIEELRGSVDVVVCTSSARTEFATEYPVLFDHTVFGIAAARESLWIDAVPAAVLLGLDGTVTAGPAFGPDEIRGLHEAVRVAAGLEPATR